MDALKIDLVAAARDAAASGLDLYDLLGVDAATAKEDVHRAWRRKGLKYHPDKAGAAYDAAKYEQFERARNVLSDDEARAAYDAALSAARQRQRQAELMGADRRRLKEELEAGERAARGDGASAAAGGADAERERLREAGRRRAEDRAREEREAEERETRREDERIAELERRLRGKEDKARRRAERKARTAAAAAAGEEAGAVGAEAGDAAGLAGAAPDAQWRAMLGAQDVPFEKRPVYAYTLSRLKAAGAQRRERLRGAGVAVAAFVPQWHEVADPEVRKYISRVPSFGTAGAAGEDTAMDTAV